MAAVDSRLFQDDLEVVCVLRETEFVKKDRANAYAGGDFRSKQLKLLAGNGKKIQSLDQLKKCKIGESVKITIRYIQEPLESHPTFILLAIEPVGELDLKAKVYKFGAVVREGDLEFSIREAMSGQVASGVKMSWFIFTVKNTSKGKIAEWHGLQGWGEISDEHGNRFKPVSPDGWQSLNGVPGLLDGVRVGDDRGKIKINPGVTYQNSVYFEPCLPSSKIAILSIQIGERTLLFRGAFQQADQRVKEAEAKAKKEREEAQRKKEEEQRAKDAEAAKKEREDEERRIEAERQMKEAEAKDRKEREDKAGSATKRLEGEIRSEESYI